MDVCGLEIYGNKLIPHFWPWSWRSSGSIDVTALLPKISVAKPAVRWCESVSVSMSAIEFRLAVGWVMNRPSSTHTRG